MVGAVRRRESPEDDPLRDVPEHLRRFDPAWFEVAATGPDGYDEASAACGRWLVERRAWAEQHGYHGSPLDWIRAQAHAPRELWRASEVWRPEADRWMTRARTNYRRNPA